MALDALAARVAERILAGAGHLITVMGRRYRAEVPEYAALSEAAMSQEVLPTSRRVVEAFFAPIARGEEPAASVLVPDLEAMSRRRLEMGVPLEPILHVYRIAGRAVFDALVDATAPGEEHVLAELGARWMDFIDQASSTVAAAYLHASHERLRRADARRGALLDALLAARDASDVAAVATEFATAFAPTYLPVLAASAAATSSIDAVVSACPAGTISGFRGQHLLLLVPDGGGDPRAVHQATGGGLVVWGEAAPPGPALSAELRHTEALLAVAAATARTGAFGPDSLPLERLVHANPRVATRLVAAILGPLEAVDRNGLLLATLRTYLRTGSVPATAAAEIVHPNTVVYRLRRVAQLTGADPRVPAEAARLVLALAARDLTPL